MTHLIAIDQGTTSTRAIVFDAKLSPVAVARYYEGLLDGFVLDALDAGLADQVAHAVAGADLRVAVADTIMRTDSDRARLARDVLDFANLS